MNKQPNSSSIPENQKVESPITSIKGSRNFLTYLKLGLAWAIIGIFRLTRFILRLLDRFFRRRVAPWLIPFLGWLFGPLLWLKRSLSTSDNEVRAAKKYKWLNLYVWPISIIVFGFLIQSQGEITGEQIYSQSLLGQIATQSENEKLALVEKVYSGISFNVLNGGGDVIGTEGSGSTLASLESDQTDITTADESIDPEIDAWLNEWQRLRMQNNQAFDPSTLLGEEPKVPAPKDIRLGFETYEVKAGDTLSSIANQYGLLAVSISANNPNSKNLIRPGQKILIPPLDGLVVTFKAKDTVAAYAKQYRLTETQIAAANPLIDFSQNIAVGTKILLPDYGGSASVFAGSESQLTPVRRPTTPIRVPTGPTQNYAGPPTGTRLLWPLESRRISQYYKYRHQALDIATPVGSRIWASDDGIVIKAGCGSSGCRRDYGYYIIIDHGNGLQTLYAHNSRLLVSVGQRVKRGEQISFSGNTGRSTGPHLHFEVRGGNRKYNPLTYTR